MRFKLRPNHKIIWSILPFAILLGCGSYKMKIHMGDEKMGFYENIFNYKGIIIRYFVSGQGQPLILLHGFGGSSYSWRHVAKVLSSDYKVILIDLKGFGLSEKPLDDEYSPADQGHIIEEFIKENSLNNIILGGHSFGGAVAVMTFLHLNKANNNPVNKLILIDSAAYEQDFPAFITLLRKPFWANVVLSILPSSLSVNIVLRKAFYDDSKVSDEMIRTYASYLNLPGANHALMKTAQNLIPHNINEIIQQYKHINIPVLLIWGEMDEIIPISIGKKLSESLPNAKLAIVPNCGHMPQEECPKETIEIVSSFLKE